MKNIFIFLIFLLFLNSCGNNEKNIIKETGDITNGYVDTLEGSIKDAKDAKALLEEKDKKLNDEIDSIKKD